MREYQHHILHIVVIVMLFSLITINHSSISSNNSNVSALSYSSSVGVGFTFNPTLSVSISPSDLVISNLVPGNTLDSNVINVSVASNASYGYTLSAIVNGNNSNLTHTNGTNTFSSIATDTSLSSLTTDNTWGYSYKLSNDTNWNNYSGLSNETSKTLVDSNDQTAIPIDFKIGAKAAGTQASGTYTGVINFTAVTKHIPITLAEAYASEGKTMVNGFYTMQDMTSTICSKVEAIGAQLQVLDKRDNKLYWISKLADNHCWMTQNLDLDLASGVPLTSDTTDLNDSSISGAYFVGYSYNPDSKVISWKPANTTRDYQNGTGTPWRNDDIAYSLNPGNWYWDGDDPGTTACNYLTNTCEYFSQTQVDNRHLSIGNYYNWSAAIASDDSSSLADSTYGSASDPDSINRNPRNSICPKGWRLPTVSYEGNIANSTSEFARVNGLYNNGITNDDKKLTESPLWFVRAGYIHYGSLSWSGTNIYYWSSTVYNSSFAYFLNSQINRILPADSGVASGNVRKRGRSVRCIAR